jgi:hypothetical protein
MIGVKLARRTWMAWCAALLLAGCRTQPPPPDLDSVASRYIQLTRELARHDPSLVDHWLTAPPPADPGGRRPVPTLHLAIDALAKDAVAALSETPDAQRARAEWLAGQTRALRLAADRLMGASLPFDTEARLAFGVTPSRPDRFQADRAVESLTRTLPGNGSLVERLARFRARFQVAPAKREPVVRAALDACREVTSADLRLPADEAVEIRFVESLPWDAHAQYLGGHRTRIDVNDSAPLDLTRALRLACHEGYAGHHAQHIWLADELVAGRGWHEYALVPGFGPALLLAEGAAEAGTELAMPPERRAEVYARRLAPVAGLTETTSEDFARLVQIEQAQAALEPLIGELSREYLDNRLNASATAERLEQEALVSGGEAFVPFIERRRTRILAYTEGKRLALERLHESGLDGLRGLFVPAPP